MAEDVIKRLRYFDHQFLQEADFTDEQKYHLDMRRRHNRLLHTAGIADGLQVQKTDAKAVKVTPGTAIDDKGQEMVLFKEVTIDLSDEIKYPANSTVYITIKYQEKPTDPQPPEQPIDNTRYTEEPLIEATTTAPPDDGSLIGLAKFQLDGNGNVPGNVNDLLDGDVRKSVGSVLADNTVSIQKLKKQLVGDASVSIPPGKTSVVAFVTDQSSPSSAFLLIYAYSTTPGAKFSWTQEYTTEGTAANFQIKQTVVFNNESKDTSDNLIDINITYRIYTVLEN